MEKIVFNSQQIEQNITAIDLPERSKNQAAREMLAREGYDPVSVVEGQRELLANLGETPFRYIGQKLVKGEILNYETAFLGMTYVVSATNVALFTELAPSIKKAHGLLNINQMELRGPAQTFLTAMAQRESLGVITPEEVAGMVAAGMMDINMRLGFEPYILETGGMGGDRGFVVEGEKKKVINASTLSAVVLSSLGIPVLKHGSYANTSAVGSTDAIEALGVNIHQSSFAQIERLFDNTSFYFSDAHVSKTIHDLSHSPFIRHETINHIIGPMTPPVDSKTRLNKIIGVNEGIHPKVIAKAYKILHDRGAQRIGNVLVVSGLNQEYCGQVDIENQKEMQKYMMLDEASPYMTLLGVVQNGEYEGCHMVTPEDFGIQIDASDIQTANTHYDLLRANDNALHGVSVNGDYLAMNAALGLFAAEYMDCEDAVTLGGLNKEFLKEAFGRCKNALLSGQSAQHLNKIVEFSKSNNE